MTARPTRSDDRGSLAMALLFTIVGVSLSALLVPTVVVQLGATRQETQRGHALHAAMAGLESAVGAIRAAVAADGRTGNLATLPPCEGTMAGDAGSATTQYRVTVHYLAVDPAGQSDQWAHDHALCTSGTPTTTPAYALLVSTGTEQVAGTSGATPSRRLRATYTFRTTNQAPPGGLIKASGLCMDAGRPPWSAGRMVTMQRCAAGAAQQAFGYYPDLTLVLTASRTAALPLGLCVDAGSPHALGNLVVLQQCQAVAPTRQTWSYNGSANFKGTTDGVTMDNYCFNVQSPGMPGSRVVLGSEDFGTCGDAYAAEQAFLPTARVGAGAANPPNDTSQVVNFDQFGRCIDVPNGRNDLGYLIAWPCKQSPNGGYPGWNQMWTLPALTMDAATCGAAGVPCGKGTITMVAPAGKSTPAGTYCLHSSGGVGPGQYADILNVCPGGAPSAALTWTVYGDTDDPLTRYHVVDYHGHCLAPSLTDLYSAGDKVGILTLVPCADSALQMWNAPAATLDASELRDISEF